ncbi:MAG: EF-hand domain-containing protein [Proteobacteria bacterium]|nr:EF-hand domain-containing protein [Pseudomonadota bacterium]MDA1355567.1 EF-hand domain-containing protein [Pseudomonadota bacterium]
MKLTQFALFPLAAALILGTWTVTPNLVQPAAAQQAEDDEERFRARFNRIDTNEDGVMAGFEYTVYRISSFNTMDGDGDGALTLEEFRDRGRQPSERRAERRTKSFARIDQNADKSMERGEWDGYADRRFARMDADKDGEVSFLEFVDYVK